jgi:hypothetical protein
MMASAMNYDAVLSATPESYYTTWVPVEVEKRTQGRRLEPAR